MKMKKAIWKICMEALLQKVLYGEQNEEYEITEDDESEKEYQEEENCKDQKRLTLLKYQ